MGACMNSKESKKNPVAAFFGAIGKFFKEFGEAAAKGDGAVKASLLVAGAGYWKRKQIIKGFLVTLLEIGLILYTVLIGVPYISQLNTLGTVERAMVYNPATMKNEVNDYDNSLLILLFGVISLSFLIVGILLWMANVRNTYRLQLRAEAGKHINTFKEDCNEMLNDKFHFTLLALPVLGVIIFNIMPLVVMICIAFTNYDKSHMPPNALFTWVGLANFKSLFTTSITSTFGYTFWRILGWTLLWAVLATFTTYFGGIILALLINNKNTKLKKLWRTLFVAAISVPQFVTLIKKLATGEEILGPSIEGYLERGIRVNYFAEERGATRGLKMLLKKIAGEPFETDLPMPKFDRVEPGKAIEDLSKAKIAIVTSGGIVPVGNPDHIESSNATKFGWYTMEGMDRMSKDDYMTIHGGYDRQFVLENPNLVIPLDALRKLQKEGVFGELYPYFASTTGTGTATTSAAKFGDEIGKKLVEEHVDAVLLVST